jgi:hypothetical protein
LEVGSGKWEVGSGKWGVGSGELGGFFRKSIFEYGLNKAKK